MDRFTSMVVVSDANGDQIFVIGPFATPMLAIAYMRAHESKKGEWYLDVVAPRVTPEQLDWEPGTDVYETLTRSGK